MDQQNQYAPMPEAGQVQPTLPPKKSLNKLGLILIIAPFATLIGVIILYAIVSFIMGAIMTAGDSGITNQTIELAQRPSAGLVVAQIINAFLGLIGLLAIVGIFTAFPAGIILLIIEAVRKNKA